MSVNVQWNPIRYEAEHEGGWKLSLTARGTGFDVMVFRQNEEGKVVACTACPSTQPGIEAAMQTGLRELERFLTGDLSELNRNA